MSNGLGRVTTANQSKARGLGDDHADTGNHEVPSKKGVAGGGVCEQRAAGEGDEHAPLIGSGTP